MVVVPAEEEVEFVMGCGSKTPPTPSCDDVLLAEVVVEGGRFVVGRVDCCCSSEMLCIDGGGWREGEREGGREGGREEREREGGRERGKRETLN